MSKSRGGFVLKFCKEVKSGQAVILSHAWSALFPLNLLLLRNSRHHYRFVYADLSPSPSSFIMRIPRGANPTLDVTDKVVRLLKPDFLIL